MGTRENNFKREQVILLSFALKTNLMTPGKGV